MTPLHLHPNTVRRTAAQHEREGNAAEDHTMCTTIPMDASDATPLASSALSTST